MTPQGSTCILSTSLTGGVATGLVTGAAGTYSVGIKVTDNSPSPITNQGVFTLTVRPEFSITQASLADAVQGRTYGVSPQSQPVTTSLAATAPPTVGASTNGNGPIATCNPPASPLFVALASSPTVSSNPGLAIAVSPTLQNQCALTSTAWTATGAYVVKVSVTDNPITVLTQTQVVVPAKTITITNALPLTVNPAISFSANFDNYAFTPTGAGTAAEVPDAVQGRTYGAVGAYGTATAGGKTSLIFTATGGLLTTKGLTFTPPAASVLPAPVQCGPATGVTYPQVSTTSATLVCSSGGAAVSGSPGAFPFNVTIGDAGNTATPALSISADTLGHSSHTLTEDAALSFSLAQAGNSTTTNPPNLLDAVSGRTYGVVGGTPTYTPTGGLGANAGALGNDYYQWCISTGTLPATFSSSGNNLNAACTAQVQSPSETLQATSVLSNVASATAYPFTVQLYDTGNTMTPSATLTNSTIVIVQPPLVATLAQAGNFTATSTPGALLPGVFNRTYGVIGGTPTFTAAGGLGLSAVGLGHYQWCVSAGALPGGFLNTGTNLNTPCTAPDVENTATLAANPITQNVTSATAFSFTVRVDDQGNAAVPSGVVSGTTNVLSSSITVNPQIQLAQSLGASWPDAVSGRAYGSGAGCTGVAGCAPAVYTATLGLGGYVWPPTTATSIPTTIAGMTCPAVAVGSATFTCSSTNITAAPTTSGAASVTYSPSATVTDTANAATPAATTTTDPASTRTDTLIVDSPLSFALAQAGNSTTPNPPNLLDAVSGRTYGVVGGTPTYTPTGGLGANNAGTLGNSLYQWCLSVGTLPATFSSTGNNLNTACTAPVQSPSETLQATSALSNVASATAYPFTVQLIDTGNGSTPIAPLTNSTTLTVQPPLVATLTQAGNPTPTTALLPGVYNRSYGVVGGTPTFTAAGGLGQSTVGLGLYQWCVSSGALPTGFSSNLNTPCTAPDVQNTATLVANPITQNVTSATAFPFTIRVDDQGNAAVPSGVTSGTTNVVATSILVNPQIQLAQSLGASWPDAVNARAYGSGSGCAGGACAPAVYTATNGLGGYVWPPTTATNIPTTIAGMACPAVAMGSATFTCDSTNITALPSAAGAASITYNPSATVTDTANAATPAATTTTDPASTRTDALVVNAPLFINSPASWLPGVASRAYGQGTGCSPTNACAPVQYTVTGGLGTYASPPTQNGFAGNFSCSLTSTGALSGTYSCSSPAVTASGTFTSSLTTQDTADATTPNAPATSTTTSFLVNPEVTVTLPATVPTAVAGRSYGLPSVVTCSGGACASLVYTVPPATPGLGGPYTFSPNNFPGVFTCPTASNNGNCQSAAVGAAGSYTTLTVTVGDAANQATPSKAVTSSASTMTVDPEMTFAAVPVLPATAVLGRTYGTGSTCGAGGSTACAPLTYTVTNGSGLPPFTYAFTPNNFPTNFTCPTSTNSGNCSATLVGGSSGTLSNLTVTVADTANVSVPNNSVTSSSTSLTVNQEMTITAPSTIPPAVLGRTYGTGSTCGAGGTTACAPLTYTVPPATPGLGGYTFTPNNFPTNFACPTSTNNGNCSATAVGGSAGTLTTPTVTVADTANASTPKNTVTSSAISLTVDSEMAFTATPPSPFATAVFGRSYGTGSTCGAGSTACTPLAYTMNSGGLGGYSYPFTVNSNAGGFTCTAGGTTTNCTSGGVTATASASAYTGVHASVTDTANASTPSNTIPSANGSLTVNPEMNFTATPTSPFADAVTVRSYGTGSSCGAGGSTACTPLTYTIQTGSGLGGYSYAFSPSISISCPGSATTTNCTSSSVGAAGSYATAHASVTDTGNASTPGNTIASSNGSLTVHPEMNFTATPSSPFADAVSARTYGQGSTCGSGSTACTPLTYTIQTGSGLGTYAYAFSPSINISCPGSGTTTNCTSSGVGASGNYTNVNVAVTDVGNASTPANTITSSPNATLLVHPELNFTATPPSPFADAVNGRTYGTGSTCGAGGGTACAPLTYTIQTGSGLGGYSYPFTVNSNAGGFTCTTGGTSTNCSAGLPSGVTAAASAYTGVHASVTDTGNASTPSNSVASSNGSLTVHLELTVTAPSVPTAVTGRAYGSTGTCSPNPTCAPLAYSLSNGLGLYTSAGSSLTDGVDTFALSFATPTYSFSAASISGAGGTAPTLTFTGAETGNASTPGNTVTDTTKTLTTNAALAVNVPTPFPIPDAVSSRTYGPPTTGCTGGTCVSLVYTPTGGLTPYTTLTGTGFPTGISCAANGGVTTLTCDSGGSNVTGSTSSGTITVTDTANASAPSGTTTRTTDTITVDAALAITNTLLPNGLLGFVYNPTGPGVTLASTGGLPTALTWISPGGALAGACVAPTGTLDPDLTLGRITGVLSSGGSALTTKSASVGAYTFQVCVTDTPNSTTPAGYALPQTTGNNYIVDVMDTLAYVAENSANAVAIINTTSNSNVTPFLTTSISAPDSVAVSPNGRQAYVTMGNNDVAVVDTITQGHFGSSPFALPAGCVAPTGIAVTPDGTQFYVACPGGNEVLVFSAVTATTTSPLTPLATISTGAASAPDSVVFKPDGTRAYVTLSGTNQLAIINTGTQAQITSSPFTLDATNTSPLGIALATDTGKIYAYIAKNATGTGNPGVEVEDVTADPTTSPLTPVTNIQTGAGSAPDSVAVLPDSSRVYVTLNGVNQFAILDNTVAAPVPTGSSVSISTATEAVNTVTITTATNHGLFVGDTVFISGVGVAGYNGTFSVATTPTATTFTYTDTAAGLAASGPGVVQQAFDLPDPAAVATASAPIGVTSPPLATVPGTGYRVYLCLSNAAESNVAVIDDLGNNPKPAKDATPTVAIDAAATPTGIAHIPVPK